MTLPTPRSTRKKLMEVALPLDAINTASKIRIHLQRTDHQKFSGEYQYA